MKRPRPPRFLARRSYRRRRMADAARLLPILGLVLVFLPILWQPALTAEPDTEAGGIYLFAVWLILIGAAFLLSRVLTVDEAPGPGAGDGPDAAAGPGPDGEAR